jgi:hypothetical protein
MSLLVGSVETRKTYFLDCRCGDETQVVRAARHSLPRRAGEAILYGQSDVRGLPEKEESVSLSAMAACFS